MRLLLLSVLTDKLALFIGGPERSHGWPGSLEGLLQNLNSKLHHERVKLSQVIKWMQHTSTNGCDEACMWHKPLADGSLDFQTIHVFWKSLFYENDKDAKLPLPTAQKTRKVTKAFASTVVAIVISGYGMSCSELLFDGSLDQAH